MIFRRERVQVFNEGGLWDEAGEVYPILGARSNRNEATFTFPAGSSVSFSHLQLADDVLAHQGSQIALIEWDELTHFLASQFWYMFSRNRSTSGVRPYQRASTNPDPDSWVADLIAWWIDQDEYLPDQLTPNPNYGFPLMERGGVLRYFVRENGEIIWADTPEEVIARVPHGGYVLGDVKSLTFIPARLEDNQILMKADPAYRSALMLLDPVERSRLLGGNWKIKAAAGVLFQRGWVQFVDAAPFQARRIRYWDRAGSAVTKDNPDPDWTVGVLMAINGGVIYIEDVVRLRGSPLEVENAVRATAELDAQRYGLAMIVGIEQDPAQAGKADAQNYIRLLARFQVRAYPVSGKGNKVLRFGPFSAQAEAKNVRVVRGDWNHAYLTILERFPSVGVHDDDADATSGAYNALMNAPGIDSALAAAAEVGPDDSQFDLPYEEPQFDF